VSLLSESISCISRYGAAMTPKPSRRAISCSSAFATWLLRRQRSMRRLCLVMAAMESRCVMTHELCMIQHAVDEFPVVVRTTEFAHA
jgi:hypothetical protein